MRLNKWARRSSLVRALYQGAPILVVHRILSAVGVYALLGKELHDFTRVQGRTEVSTGSASSKRRVLFVIPRNFRTHATFQAGLAQALALRGAECAIATCGGIMPVCEVTWAEQESFPRCARCTAYLTDLAKHAGISHHKLNEYQDVGLREKIVEDLASLTIEELLAYAWDGLPMGRFSLPPARWRLRSHDVAQHPQGRSVIRAFIRGGVVWADAMRKILQEFKPDVVVMLNGLFMEERVTWAVTQRRGCRCVFFERGRDAGTVFLSHETSAPRYDISDTWKRAAMVPLDEEQRRAIIGVMDRRTRGEQMVETYWSVKESDQERIRQHLRLDPESPLAVLFTNVVWDTAMQDRDTIFDGMLDWLRHTIELFRVHRSWTLIIRIHPAETQVPGRESYDSIADWIQEDVGTLPENVRLILPKVPIDSYVLMRMAHVGCVYASTVGLEMAVSGTPVVVAGAAHYSAKGFTYDPSSPEDYSSQVEAIMAGRLMIPRSEQVELALRYSYAFFLRRTLPMTVLTEKNEARPRLTYDSLNRLLPHKNEVLDVICDGILQGTEFELLAPS